MADGKEIYKNATCAGCSYPSGGWHGINDLPTMPLCPVHLRMAYDDPEQLMEDVRKRKRKPVDKTGNAGIIEIGESK